MPETEVKNTSTPPEHQIALSPFVQEIDALLIGDISLRVVRKKMLDLHNESFSIAIYGKRRKKLRADAEKAKKAFDKIEAVEDPRPESMMYQLKSIEQTMQRTMELRPDPSDPSYALVTAMQTQIRSFVRLSAEYYSEVDHLALLRFVLNTQHARVSQMRELELKMGMLLRDNTDNLSRLADMTVQSLEAHQSLGLKPKFGDPTMNLNVNVGSGGNVSVNTPQSERNKRLEEIELAVKGLVGEERDMKIRDLLFGPVEAKFEDVKVGRE